MTTQEIINDPQSISLENVQPSQGRFCQIWPTVKEGLTLLQDLVKNKFVKYTIAGVIAAGEAITSSICGKAQLGNNE